jgi:hypothetical protein
VRPAQRTGYRPGQVLQVDWAEMPTRPRLSGRERRVYALTCSLPWSGASTAHFSFDMTIESFLEGHVRAFDWLGGVPREYVEFYSGPGRLLDMSTGQEPASTHCQFGFIDLIVNLPLNSLMRAILAAHHGGGSGPGAAGRLLNHHAPIELIRPDANRPNRRATIEAIRSHYDAQLVALGFKQPARRTVNFPADNPYYDILLASRHDRGLELWNKTNPLPVDPQLSLLGDDAADSD